MNNESTLTKFLNGINHSLNIANKAIPVYNQAKPLIKNVHNTYHNIKNNKDYLKNIIKLNKVKKQIKKDMNDTQSTPNFISKNKIKYNNINNPKFFI